MNKHFMAPLSNESDFVFITIFSVHLFSLDFVYLLPDVGHVEVGKEGGEHGLEAFFHNIISTCLVVGTLHLVDVASCDAGKHGENSLATHLVIGDDFVQSLSQFLGSNLEQRV
jgi:hypothetical protein